MEMKVEYQYVSTLTVDELNELGDDGWKPHNLQGVCSHNDNEPYAWSGLLYREVKKVYPRQYLKDKWKRCQPGE